MTILYHLWASGARFASQLPHVRFVLLLHFVSAFVLYLTSVRFETKDSVILASVVDTNASGVGSPKKSVWTIHNCLNTPTL